MKALVLISLPLIFALATPVAAGSSPPEAGPEKVREFRAEFDVPNKGGGFTNYIIGARQTFDGLTDELQSRKAFAYRNQCEGDPSDIPMRCRSTGGGPAKLAKFRISDDFGEAYLILKDSRYTHSLRFVSTGRPLPYPDLFANACGIQGWMLFTELRTGEAKGQVMGRHLSWSDTSDARPEMTYIAESVCI